MTDKVFLSGREGEHANVFRLLRHPYFRPGRNTKITFIGFLERMIIKTRKLRTNSIRKVRAALNKSETGQAGLGDIDTKRTAAQLRIITNFYIPFAAFILV